MRKLKESTGNESTAGRPESLTAVGPPGRPTVAESPVAEPTVPRVELAEWAERYGLVAGLTTRGSGAGTPFSLGRHLRDAHSAQLMISNDRILGNTSNLLLVHKQDTSLVG